MAKRQVVIAHSITNSILHKDGKRKSFLSRIPNFFWIYWLAFDCVNDGLFQALREVWQLKEAEYQQSFGEKDDEAAMLTPIGTCGVQDQTVNPTDVSR